MESRKEVVLDPPLERKENMLGKELGVIFRFACSKMSRLIGRGSLATENEEEGRLWSKVPCG